MTSLLTFAQRSLFKLGDDIADLFVPAVADQGTVRPAAIPGPAASGVALRWTDRECFRTQTTRLPVNDNRPPRSGIGPILVEDEIGFSGLSFDRRERVPDGRKRQLALRPKQASFPALNEVVSDDSAVLTQGGA